MAKQNVPIELKLKITYGISLWHAIKLRIAGKNFKPIVEEILKQIKQNIVKE